MKPNTRNAASLLPTIKDQPRSKARDRMGHDSWPRLDPISPKVGSVAMRAMPASSRQRAPADRRFTQCRYIAAAVITVPIIHSTFRRSEVGGVERGFAICIVRFSEQVFRSANPFCL